jgi:hypothetical protein
MGKGRPWSRALRSKVTPTGRWVPKTNSHAACVGMQLSGKKGGDRGAVKSRFTAASKACVGK